MSIEFRLPDIGEGVHEGEIVQWLVKTGDTVREDQPLLEVMTDKVTAEIPSPVSGRITDLRGKPGEVIMVGSVIVVLEPVDAPASGSAKSSAAQAPVEDKQLVAASTVATPSKVVASCNGSALPIPRESGSPVLAAPATRRMARVLNVELSQVAGSGPKGRITPDDVRQFQASGGASAKPYASPVPKQTFSHQAIAASVGDKRVPFAGMRKKIAEHLVKSKFTAPHFAYVDEVDMTALSAMREDLKSTGEELGVKLSYLPFIIKAVIAGLRQFPILNSQLDETTQEIVYKGDVHMGVAVATPDGLVVPVIKNADQKNILALASEIKVLAEKARANKLSLDDIRGGTFTLTSIGSIGGLFGVPIINHPEVGILGINKISQRPVVRDGQIVIRDMMYLSLSADHRIVDGAEAAQFVNVVIDYLEHPAKLLLQ